MASFDQALALPGAPRLQWSKLLDRARTLARKSAAILAFLVLWEVAPRTGLVESAFLPPVSLVLKTAWVLVENGQLANHLGASLSRALIGFGLSVVLAVPLGLAIGWSRRIEQSINPLLEAMRNTAPLALLPVFILLLGIGEPSKIAIVVYACAFPVLVNSISGVRNVDPLLIKSARTMGLSEVALLRKVILPAALPSVFTGIRLASTFSLLVLVAAEMIGAKAGLGYLIIYSQYNFQIPEMFVGILTLTVVGLVFTQTLSYVEGRLMAWQPTVNE